jgi:hypothetical protein
MVGIFNHTTQELTYDEITPSTYDPNTGSYIPATFDYIVATKEESQTSPFIMPGMRFQKTDRKAFQISLAGVSVFSQSNSDSFPLPMVSWFYKF